MRVWFLLTLAVALAAADPPEELHGSPETALVIANSTSFTLPTSSGALQNVLGESHRQVSFSLAKFFARPSLDTASHLIPNQFVLGAASPSVGPLTLLPPSFHPLFC